MLKITLRTSDGSKKHYEQDFVPLSKLISLLKLTPENYPDLTQSDWLEKNAELVANCFDNPEVTKNAILKGVAAWEADAFFDGFTQQMLGVDPKKAEAEQ